MKPASEKEPRRNPNSHPAKLPRGYCKKLKRNHEFRYQCGKVYRVRHMGRTRAEDYTRDWCIWEYRCVGCGKKKVKTEYINQVFGQNQKGK
jgi:hypothetical protein